MHARMLGSAVLGAIGMICPASFGQDAPLTIYHFDEPRALILDPTRVVVRVEGMDDRSPGPLDTAIVEALTSAGLDGAGAAPAPYPGWWMAPIDSVRAQGRTPVDIVRDAIEALDRVADRGAGRVTFVSPVFVDDFGGPMWATPQILAQFDPAATRESIEQVLAETGAGTVIEADWGGIKGSYRIDPGTRSGVDALARAGSLAQRGDVVYAEPNMVFTGRSDTIPNDPYLELSWGLRNTAQFLGFTVDADMNGLEAWDTTMGSPSVITVVLDCGVQQDHPDIRQITGIDTTPQVWGPGDGSPFGEWDNHGTTVAGCISEIANNGIGTAGVAPNTRIMSARTFVPINSSGSWIAEFANTVNSLTFAYHAGARISNNSNSYGYGSAGIEFTYQTLRTVGMVHFASAGNSGIPYVGYPAILPSVMAIGAIDPAGHKAYFSSYGPDMDFLAPGMYVYTTDRTGIDGYYTGDYGYMNGTSFSSPYAAGVAALIMSQCPSITAAEVEAKMIASCRNMRRPGKDDWSGWGLLRADLAVSSVGAFPCDFTLVSPPSGAQDVDPRSALTFDWTDAAWADHYILELTGKYGDVIATHTVTGASSFDVPANTLKFSDTVHWVVRAVNATGETPSSPEVFAFTTVPTLCSGDINRDGKTNIRDFQVLATQFGKQVPTSTGADLIGDGIVNILDFHMLAGDFTCGTAPPG